MNHLKRKTPSKILFFVLLWLLLFPVWASAQDIIEPQWQGPRRISRPGVEIAGEAAMALDPYGTVHVVWSEVDPDDEVNTIVYTTFDGQNWGVPIDIRAAAPGLTIGSYDAVVYGDRVYVVWTEGTSGPVYIASASVFQSDSYHDWSRPLRLDMPAYRLKLNVDSKGVFHMMFVDFFGREPGIYYVYSKDFGETWTNPYWIDPDIPVTSTPNVLQFVLDDKDGLHASWYYVGDELSGSNGEMIRYTHSLDGGKSWMTPVTIDVNDQTIDELRIPYPGLAVAGDTVHMIWAGTTETYREHRYSLDRGKTWSETFRVFGNLQGQALGDAMVADASGRLHFFGQIRWPQYVYHFTWTIEDGWSDPAGIYLISRDGNEGRQGRYHAHALRAIVRNGNEMLVTFTDEAVGPLYAMWKTLPDVTAVPPAPTPTPEIHIEPSPTPVPVTPTPTRIPLDENNQRAPLEPPNTGSSVWLGIVPALVLVSGVFLFYAVWRRRWN